MLVALLLRRRFRAGWGAGRQFGAADDWPFPATSRSPLADRLFIISAGFPVLTGWQSRRHLRFTAYRGRAGCSTRSVGTRGLPNAERRHLVFDLGHPLRALVVNDFKAMFQAAERDRAYPAIVSGYRSAEYQVDVFEQAVQRRGNRELQRAEGLERQTARSVAPPGRCPQHQLGTTADLSSYELGFGLRAAFAETQAGRSARRARLGVWAPTAALHRRGRAANRSRCRSPGTTAGSG